MRGTIPTSILRATSRYDALPDYLTKELQMSDEENQPRGRRDGDRKKRKTRETVNIEFARSLSTRQLNTILQMELIRARGQKPAASEVSLPVEIVHDIKFRLRYYERFHGEVDRKGFFEKDNLADEDTED